MIIYKRLIKSIIISILLLIFCFILGIFDVKANEGNLEIFDVQDLQYAYKENGSTYTENLTLAPDDFDGVTIYDLFYYTATDTYVENKSPRAYYSIRGIINNGKALNYLAFIVYSPTQLELNKLEVCLWNEYGQDYCILNDNNTSNTSVTEILLNGTTSSYFYLIRTSANQSGFINNSSYPINKFGLSWYSSDTLYSTLPNSYLISGLLDFESETDRDNWLSSYSDYLQNYAPDEPNLPDNPYLELVKPDVNTGDWTVVIGGWNTDFNPSINNPISNLAQLPIIFLTSVNNAISGTCSPVNYIELYNYQVVLPCLNLSTRLGVVWTIIDTIFSCMLIYSIGKSLVLTFARLSDMDTNIMYECYSEGMQRRGRDIND